MTFVYKTLRELSGSRCCCVSVPFAAQKSEPPPPPSLLSLVRARRPEAGAAAVAVVVSCPCPAAAVAVVACIRSSPPRSWSRRHRCCHGLVSMPCAAQKPEPPLLSRVRPCPPSREEMETQRPPPAPACKQSGDITEACPSCRIFPDDPSFCLWLNHSKIHQALALPGVPCAQGATEQEIALLFSKATWKIACGAISPAVTYRNHVPSYRCEGKWKDHPFVLHRLKMSDSSKIIRLLELLLLTDPESPPPPPHSRIGLLKSRPRWLQ